MAWQYPQIIVQKNCVETKVQTIIMEYFIYIISRMNSGNLVVLLLNT